MDSTVVSPLPRIEVPGAVAGSCAVKQSAHWGRKALNLMARWGHNMRTRRQLAQLDERQMADFGLYGAERAAELDKPFWR